MLKIHLLGKVNMTYHGGRIDDQFNNKLVALLCLLMLNLNKDLSKDRLAAYLWPDSKEDAARYNLRYNLWMLHKLIPPDQHGESLILSDKDYCRINEKYLFECDRILLDRFNSKEQHSVESLIQLKDLFRGDFLEGLYLKNCNEFNELILFERVVCQNKQLEILKTLANLYQSQELFDEELQLLNDMVAIEPYNESFAYRVIEIHTKLGNRAAGIQYYKNFENSLRRNLNISPDRDLKQLYIMLSESPAVMKNEMEEKKRGIKKKIVIEGRCLKEIEYYWVADVIQAMMKAADKKYMLTLDKKFILDLSYIQTGLLQDFEHYVSDDHSPIGFVPSVRVLQAFSKFLEQAALLYDLEIRIVNAGEMDALSLNILKSLENNNTAQIKFVPLLQDSHNIDSKKK
jgi:DNA-binding SARP family transcriptional activator